MSCVPGAVVLTVYLCKAALSVCAATCSLFSFTSLLQDTACHPPPQRECHPRPGHGCKWQPPISQEVAEIMQRAGSAVPCKDQSNTQICPETACSQHGRVCPAQLLLHEAAEGVTPTSTHVCCIPSPPHRCFEGQANAAVQEVAPWTLVMVRCCKGHRSLVTHENS